MDEEVKTISDKLESSDAIKEVVKMSGSNRVAALDVLKVIVLLLHCNMSDEGQGVGL